MFNLREGMAKLLEKYPDPREGGIGLYKNGQGKLGSRGRALLIVFFASYLDVINYRDMKLFVFSISPPFVEFLYENKEVLVLGNYTLETEHGPVYLKPFCKIIVMYNKISKLSDRKRMSHDLRVLGSKLSDEIEIRFYDNEEIIRVITQGREENARIIEPGTFVVDGVETYAVEIRFRQDNTVSGMTMPLLGDVGIVLSDGTEIKGKYGYGVLWFETDETWRLHGDKYLYNFLVKRAGQEGYEEYSAVNLRSHWGEFIEGILPEERGPRYWY
jgi:hypothetical protein